MRVVHPLTGHLWGYIWGSSPPGRGEEQDWQVAKWVEHWGTKVSRKEEAEAGQRNLGGPMGREPLARLPSPPWRAGGQTDAQVSPQSPALGP